VTSPLVRFALYEYVLDAARGVLLDMMPKM
jgi:hypothetical protein